MNTFTAERIEYYNKELEARSPEYILKWAWENFTPKIASTSSFQTQSVPLLHMISAFTPKMEVLFLDTGYHFPETLSFRDELIELLHLNVRNLKSRYNEDGHKQVQQNLYSTDPELCCYINKVEPLQNAKQSLDAWISGIRRDQTENRKNTPVIERQKDGTLKICPLVTWTAKDINDYRRQYNLPEHPLTNRGYLSIGCAPCTRPVGSDEDYRAGRWSSLEKTECGLHLDNYKAEDDK